MPGLRAKQKERRMAEILNAAAKLFSEKGYSQTNVEEIAERAEVGVATVYKYFGAKGGLIRELWKPEIELMRTAGDALIAAPPSDPAEAAARLIATYKFGETWQHRDLLRAIGGLSLGYADIFQGIRTTVDNLVLGQIKDLLAHFQENGKIVASLDLNDLAAIIYGLLNEHFQQYAIHEDRPIEQIRSDLHRRILLVFKAWTTMP